MVKECLGLFASPHGKKNFPDFTVELIGNTLQLEYNAVE